MKHYEKQGQRFREPLLTNGRQIFNPTPDQLAAEGWVLTESSEPQQPSEESQARWRIAQLEEALRGNDYKIIKCFEASALGAEMPYDLAALHAEREKAREEINDLQQKFNI